MANKKPWIIRHAKDIIIDGFIVFFVLGLITVGGVFIWVSTLEIPDLSSFEQRRVLQSTKIYDRTGEILLYDLHQDVRRTIVPFEDISYHIKNATVAIEDDHFYSHFGVDIKAIIRAALSNLTAGDLLGGQGGSTITQQVIKNSILENEKRLTRKIKEAILSIKLERLLSKDEILGHYLNESPYGGTIYGVEEASHSFFGKSAKDLTLPEAAYLSALPQAPTRLSPYGNNRDLLDNRQDLVIKRMLLNGFINQEEYDQAIDVEVTFQPQAVTGIRAPHFVMYVKEQLVEKYGEEALSDKGFRVTTSLDWELQQEAERVVAEKVAINREKYNANNAGLVAVQPQTGDILVMVGSRDYFDDEIEGNFNVTLSPRQPGSSIKPVVYASAFSNGYTPDTILYDVKTQFSTSCDVSDTSSITPCYSPNNYNGKFKGPVTLRNALPQSLNIPAVKVLYLTGLKNAIKLAGDMGITTLNDPDRLGLTLVLGGGEVKLLEHTGAYGVFANEGVRAQRRSILKVEDSSGNIIEEPSVQSQRVLDRDVSLMIADILSDNEARAPLWGYNSLVNFPNRDVAAKSGSTNNLRDAWIMGFAPNLAVGVWVGNNDNDVMGGGLSGLIATPLWRAFMDIALEKVEVQSFAEAPAVDQNLKPILRGETLDTAALIESIQTGSTTLDLAGIASNMHSVLHFVSKDNPDGPYPSNPANDGQYKYWEYGVEQWKKVQYAGIIPQVTEEDVDEESLGTENE
ncbi:MAG: penicillin-binding protein 1C [Acidimicrobiales bacterium]|jgi:penicillin-binding protein 1C